MYILIEFEGGDVLTTYGVFNTVQEAQKFVNDDFEAIDEEVEWDGRICKVDGLEKVFEIVNFNQK